MSAAVAVTVETTATTRDNNKYFLMALSPLDAAEGVDWMRPMIASPAYTFQGAEQDVRTVG